MPGVTLSLAITVVIGFLSNDETIITALNPFSWGLQRTPYIPAWILVALVPIAIALATHDFRNRRADTREHQQSLTTLSLFQSQAAAEQSSLREKLTKLHAEHQEERARRTALDEELLNRTYNIEASLRNTSVRSYLPGLDEAVRDSHAALLLVLRPPNARRKQEEMLKAVRYVLYAAANLVKTFEGRPVGVLYTANIMMFRAANSLTAASEAELRSHMIAPDLYPTLSTLGGVLELREELTASTENTREIRADHRLGRLVLPVPARYSEPDSLAFPGAPTAFCSKSMDVCPNVYDLPDRCEREGVLPTQKKEVLRSYFVERAAHIRSFISLPLFPAHDEDHPCGVVNINCSLTGLLREQPRQEEILPHLRTLLWNLPEMIAELDATRVNRRTSNRSGRNSGQTRR